MTQLNEISEAIGALREGHRRAEEDRKLIIGKISELKTIVETHLPQQERVNVQVGEMYPFYRRTKKALWIGAGIWLAMTGAVAIAGDTVATYFGWGSKP